MTQPSYQDGEKITQDPQAPWENQMQGYDKDDLSGMVEKITSGSTKALGNIEMDGYSSDNLTSMLEKVTEGATGALSDISMDGLDESEFQDLVGKIGDGATNSLGEIRMTGYDHEKPPSDLTDKINLGTNDGFKKLKTRSKAAYVTGVTATQSDGTYGTGSEISVRVTFSQNVFVEGSPSLVLETGSINRSATYASGSSSSNLVFSYIIQSSDLSPDLDYASASALVLNGGSIKDSIVRRP